MADESAIATRGLTKQFGQIRAVDGLDLDVARGEVFGWLGPNGAGKTTTVRLLLDFVRPTAGTATVLGGTGADPEIRRRIGYLPGDLKLEPLYTTAEVIDFFGGLRGGVDTQWVHDLLERFGLDPDRPIRELSTGNRRKVGIVQAFMHRPELLILDEPTSGLDPLLQREFNALVREALAWGATVFLSSHVLPEVEALADRVGILRRGKLVAVASVPELRATARQRLDFYVDGPVELAELRRLPEVIEATLDHSGLHLLVEGSVDRAVKLLADSTVKRIVSHDTDLEDVFLRYYAEGEP
jgi:ABC-2 type transport system ATP-binding protein